MRRSSWWVHPMLWMTAGLLTGLLAASLMPSVYLDKLAAQSHWPAHGLVIYAQPAAAEIVLAEQSGQNFTLGHLGSDGTFCAPDLAPGNYHLALIRRGYKTYEQAVEIKPEGASVIGFPTPIAWSPQ